MLDLCPPHLAMGSIPYWSGVLTQIIQWALRFSISVEQPCLAAAMQCMLRYLTICKNPILLQLVDIPKCHLEVDELDDVL
jgi:hypothetical protein